MDDNELALFIRLLNEAFWREAEGEAQCWAQDGRQPDPLQVECYRDGKLYTSSDGGETWALVRESSDTSDAERLLKAALEPVMNLNDSLV